MSAINRSVLFIYLRPFNVQTGEKHEPMILTLDIGNLEVIPSKAETALSFFGHVDILINNAGQSYRGLGTDTEMEVHMKLMTINYFGQIALAKGKDVIWRSSTDGEMIYL